MATTKIQGNASGSGSVTVKAPNTNNNTTVTLPTHDVTFPATATAQGDILYASGAGVLANLAKGSAGQALKMNSGATAPEWAAAGGVTHIDTWVLTTSFTGNANIITSNLARSTTEQMSQLGTGVTESSGVFTLPVTGHWLIIFRCHIKLNGLEKHYEGGIRISTDSGGSFTLEAENKAFISNNSAVTHGSTLTTYILDCTNTSTQKVGFDVRCDNSSTQTGGHTSYDATYMRFIRLADT